MLKFSWSYFIQFLKFEHSNKYTIVKFEYDVKTPWKENDLKMIIFKFKQHYENNKAKKFKSNPITIAYNISCVLISYK